MQIGNIGLTETVETHKSWVTNYLIQFKQTEKNEEEKLEVNYAR